MFLKNRETGEISLLSRPDEWTNADGGSTWTRLSGNGNRVAFWTAADNLIPYGSSAPQSLLLDRNTNSFEILGTNSLGVISTDGNSTPMAISSNGRFVLLDSAARDLDFRDVGLPPGYQQLFIRDTRQGLTRRVTRGPSGEFANNPSFSSLPNAISASGRFVVFTSHANNLVAGGGGKPEVYLFDLHSDSVTIVSKNMNGQPSNGSSQVASISRDGRYVAFQSDSSDLVLGDNNQRTDIFRWDRISNITTRVSLRSDGTELAKSCTNADISPSGRFITFESTANDLVPGDTNGYQDCFRKDTVTGEVIRMSLNDLGNQGDHWSKEPIFAGGPGNVLFMSRSSNFGGNGDALYMRTLPITDSDGDHLSDLIEADAGTNPMDRDSDDDGLSDWEEISIFGTDPLLPDTDGDLLWDGLEAGRDSPIPGDPANGILGTDASVFRPDLDPASSTDPADADSDEDGLLDGEEDLSLDGFLDSLESNPLAFDTDGDGLSDGLESGITARHLATDSVRFIPDLNPATTTSPILSDTDGGGMSDGQEDINGDGAFQFGEFDPLNASDDRFDLVVPPLIAGTSVVLEINNARPGSTGVVAYSLTGSGPSDSGRGFEIELSQPINMLTAKPLFQGHGDFPVDVPATAPNGMTVWIQAVEEMYYQDVYRTSNLITAVIQ